VIGTPQEVPQAASISIRASLVTIRNVVEAVLEIVVPSLTVVLIRTTSGNNVEHDGFNFGK
jgi:hypothetical protein